MNRRTPFVPASTDTLHARPVKRRWRVPPPFFVAQSWKPAMPEARPGMYAREPMALPPGWLDGPGRSREAAAMRGVRITYIA
ncbi:MAG TPA: hypothetical protein VND91_03250 [Candidatus Saccharimonadia bacterium]|nr:hypothetical protein [Candidatus Saccharimonadia bacterium]